MSEEEGKIRAKADPAGVSLSDEAIDWLVRLGSGHASATDTLAFRRWRERSAAHESAAVEAEALLRGVLQTRQAERLRRGGEPVPVRRAGTAGRRLVLTGAIAASVVVVAAALPTLGPLSSLYADHATSVGERRRIVLPDGSVAMLNTASAFSIRYSGSERRVVLHEGEASFEVNRDPARPFIVSARGIEARAVGTAFIVNLVAPGESVTVVEGTVEVSTGDAAPVRLTSGQRLERRAGMAPELLDVDVETAAAWRRGKLIFNNRPLQSVVAELQRYRPGRIAVAGEQLKALRITGVFDIDDPDRLLRAIGEATGARIIPLPLLTIIY